ncbi:sporulation protein YunB [Priestia koreensis]|uniref:sporulation protein YunB n=1 Tax=Priestia koreensis TaxID=284581 RepID=UPI003019C1DB
MPKIRRRQRRGPLPFRYVLLLTVVFFIFSTMLSIWVINRGIEPTLMNYAESQTNRIATLVINKAINKKLADDLDTKGLIEIDRDSKGETGIYSINESVSNRVWAEVTRLLEENLKAAEKGHLDSIELPADVELEQDKKMKSEGIIYRVPLGRATDNALLGNLGPMIPVKFHVIGDARTDIQRRIKEFGINNALFEVYIHVKVNVQVIIPFATKETTITTDIPLATALLKGDVPDYYNNGRGEGTSIQIPSSSKSDK